MCVYVSVIVYGYMYVYIYISECDVTWFNKKKYE